MLKLMQPTDTDPMQPIDTDPLTILVWSDWLEEHNQLDLAQEVRAEVTKEPEQHWSIGYSKSDVGSIGVGDVGARGVGIVGFGVGVEPRGGVVRAGGVGFGSVGVVSVGGGISGVGG